MHFFLLLYLRISFILCQYNYATTNYITWSIFWDMTTIFSTYIPCFFVIHNKRLKNLLQSHSISVYLNWTKYIQLKRLCNSEPWCVMQSPPRFFYYLFFIAMDLESIRLVMDKLKKRQKKHNGKYKTGKEFWIYFYAELFNLLTKK